jgi:EAL and modified HD-GYP domain-containing signal transduction protein
MPKLTRRPAKELHTPLMGCQFVARQPVFDRRLNVFGYELLFRSGSENWFAHADGDAASRRVILNSVSVFGMDSLVGTRRAFVNLTRQALLEEAYTVLPRQRTVLEILETVEPTEEVLTACQRLKQQGYLLALDDFVYRPEFDRLLPLADIIKVDFLVTRGPERHGLAARFPFSPVRLLAEKVETWEDYHEALEAGYSYFQGYFFCKPEVLSRHEIPGSRVRAVEMLRELNQSDTNFERLEELVKREVSLSVKLLHYLNSAVFGWHNRVGSIRQALMLLGTQTLKKWMSLLAMTAVYESRPPELLLTCLLRARFCELLGRAAAISAKEFDIFLVGLLSALDVAMNRPLGEMLEELGTSPEVEGTLLGKETALADVYQLVLAFERGEWPDVATLAAILGIREEQVASLYGQSIKWAEAIRSAD